MIHISPSYVNPDSFHASVKIPNTVAMVGRNSPEKNFDLALEALRGLSWAIPCLLQNIPNSEIANTLSKKQIFLIPSSFDQSPKVVREAMLSKCLVVASEAIPGIRDEENGFVCQLTVQSIQDALNRARWSTRKDEILHKAYMETLKAMRKTVETEIQIFKEVCYAR